MQFGKQIKRFAKNVLYGPRMHLLYQQQRQERLSTLEIIDKACGFTLARQCKDGFCFTDGHTDPDLYSTAYAISLLGLCKRLDMLNEQQKRAVVNYFAAHQNSDGLYRARNLDTPQAETGQSWGYMHLLPHILIALDYLEAKPQRDFNYINRVFKDIREEDWLESIFAKDYLGASNFFMNILVVLLYARDVLADEKAGALAKRLNYYVLHNILPRYIRDPRTVDAFDRSKSVKTIYHLLPSLCYDNELPNSISQGVADLTLATQNSLGSYGVCILSDACEDIDSIYNLIILRHKIQLPAVDNSLRHALRYMPINQNPDGGFVFRRYTTFCYGGARALSSAKDQSNMFGTWFRMLAYAFAEHAISKQAEWSFSCVPGYQWHP